MTELNSCSPEDQPLVVRADFSRDLMEQRLLHIAGNAQEFVRAVIGKESYLVGSLALGVFSETSDIDLAVGVPSRDLRGILKRLKEVAEFRGERAAGKESSRYLFCTELNGVHIDINVMTESDCEHLVTGMRRARAEMSNEERSNHLRERQILQCGQDQEALDVLKLQIYKRFCPELVWLPDFQIRKALKGGSQVEFGELRLPPVTDE